MNFSFFVDDIKNGIGLGLLDPFHRALSTNLLAFMVGKLWS